MPPDSLLFGDRPRLVVYPLLIASAYVLSLAVPNEARIADMARPLAVAVVAASVLILAGWAAFRDRWAGALAATLAILVIVSLVPLLRTWELLTGMLGPAGASAGFAVMLIVLFGGLAIMVRRARRRRRPVPRPSAGLLNIFAVALLGLIVLPSVPAYVSSIVDGGVAGGDPGLPGEGEPTGPDMVVVLLDGYPRADVLMRRFGIDNTALLDALRQRGFDVGEESRSNYVSTSTTLASLFQMRYLDEVPSIGPLIGVDGAHRRELREATNRSPAFSLLEAAGYEVISIPSGWIHTTLAPASDTVLDHGELTDLERTLIERTWLLDFVDLVQPAAFADSQRSRIVRAFDDLEAFATHERDTPAFLFAHLPAPHLPLVLDENGQTRPFPSRAFEATSPETMGISRGEYVAAWNQELAYLNDRILAVVDALQDSPREPVIVLLADHGYNYEPRDDDLQSRFGTFFAAYTPGADGLLAEAPTPVNLLPVLFNRYLGTDLALAPDRHFMSPSDEQPLLVTQVTDPERAPAE